MIDFVLFFQHLPPYPGAGSLRAKSVISGLRDLIAEDQANITVMTSTADAEPQADAEIIVLQREVENSSGLLSRVLGEVALGLIAAKSLPFRLPKKFVLVISTPAYLSAIILSSVARFRGIRYIIELRDIYPQVYADSGLLKRSSVLYRFFARLSRKMYAKSALTITATKGLAREVKHEADSANVAHVYNGFPERLAKVDIEKHPRFTVCFHGVMGFFQDIGALIELAGNVAIHNIDVVVIGYGSQSSLAANCSLPNFHFKGRLSFDDTIAEIARCHIGVSFRKDGTISQDAFPVKVWEYLGLGLPTIVTPFCEAGAFLEESACGLQFEEGANDAIASKIIELSQNAELLKQLSSNCQNVRMKYTREELGKQLAQLILDAS